MTPVRNSSPPARAGDAILADYRGDAATAREIISKERPRFEKYGLLPSDGSAPQSGSTWSRLLMDVQRRLSPQTGPPGG